MNAALTEPTRHRLSVDDYHRSERFDRQIKVLLYAQHGVPAVMLLAPESGHYECFTDLVEGS